MPSAGLTIFRRRLQGTRGDIVALPRGFQQPRLLGNRLTVDPRTLTPLVLVRIQVPQPLAFLKRSTAYVHSKDCAISRRFRSDSCPLLPSPSLPNAAGTFQRKSRLHPSARAIVLRRWRRRRNNRLAAFARRVSWNQRYECRIWRMIERSTGHCIHAHSYQSAD